jgi:hypothetical protein
MKHKRKITQLEVAMSTHKIGAAASAFLLFLINK